MTARVEEGGGMLGNLPRLVLLVSFFIVAFATQPLDVEAQSQPAPKDAEADQTGSDDTLSELGKNLKFRFFIDGEWWQEGGWGNLPLFQNNNDTGLNLFNFDTDTTTPVPGLDVQFALPDTIGPIILDFEIRGFDTGGRQSFNQFTVPQGLNARLFPIDGSNAFNLNNNFNNITFDFTRYRLETSFGVRGQVLGGKSWSDFMAVEHMSETLDFAGPQGNIIVREAQVRYIHSFGGGTTLAVVVENPNISHSFATDLDYGEHVLELNTGIIIPRIFSDFNLSGLLDVLGGIVILDTDLNANQTRGNQNFAANDSGTKATYRFGSRLEFKMRPFTNFPGIGFGLRSYINYQGASPTVQFPRSMGQRVVIGYEPRLVFGAGGFFEIPFSGF